MAKKRANGEGSIRRRSNGRWEGRYTAGIDPATGKSVQKSVSAKTQAECRERLRQAIRDSQGLTIDHTGDYTVAEWCRLWYKTYSKPNLRFSTADSYRVILEKHIIPAIGGIKLRQLTALHIQQMYNHSKEQGRVRRWEKTTDFSLSNSTVRRIHMVLNSCLQQAVKERIISYNPYESCRVPKLEKKEMTIIPPEKVGAYLQAAEQYGVLPIFYLELTSGLRRGELLGLQWSDLDQENQLITVNKQLSKINGELVLTTPKTQNSIRKVAVPKQTVELLIAEHEKHPDSPLMFASPRTGSYWSPDAIGRVHKKLLAMAEIDSSVRFHDLRHTFATFLMQDQTIIVSYS